MNIKISLLALLLSFGAQAKMATYESEGWHFNTYNLRYSGETIQENYYSTLGNGLVFFPLNDLLGKRWLSVSDRPEKKQFIEKYSRASHVRQVQKANPSFKCDKDKLECFKADKYEAALMEYKSVQDKIEELKESKATFAINGLTETLGKVSFTTSVSGKIASHVYKEGETIEYLGVSHVKSCMDEYGQWHNAQTQISSSTDIEVLIGNLMKSSVGHYVRCVLKVESISLMSLDKNSMLLADEALINISRSTSDITIESKKKFPRANDSELTTILKRTDLGNESRENLSELNDAVSRYVDFIRFEYGLVLSEIATSEMPKAQAQLKVQNFLKENKNNIREMIKNITKSLNNVDILDQIATSFAISQIYSSVRALEGKLETTIKLDHIVR